MYDPIYGTMTGHGQSWTVMSSLTPIYGCNTAFVLAFLLAFVLAFVLAFLLAFVLTFLLEFLLACALVCFHHSRTS